MSNYFKEGIRNFKYAIKLEKLKASQRRLSIIYTLSIVAVLIYFITRVLYVS